MAKRHPHTHMHINHPTEHNHYHKHDNDYKDHVHTDDDHPGHSKKWSPEQTLLSFMYTADRDKVIDCVEDDKVQEILEKDRNELTKQDKKELEYAIKECIDEKGPKYEIRDNDGLNPVVVPAIVLASALTGRKRKVTPLSVIEQELKKQGPIYEKRKQYSNALGLANSEDTPIKKKHKISDNADWTKVYKHDNRLKPNNRIRTQKRKK